MAVLRAFGETPVGFQTSPGWSGGDMLVYGGIFNVRVKERVD